MCQAQIKVDSKLLPWKMDSKTYPKKLLAILISTFGNSIFKCDFVYRQQKGVVWNEVKVFFDIVLMIFNILTKRRQWSLVMKWISDWKVPSNWIYIFYQSPGKIFTLIKYKSHISVCRSVCKKKQKEQTFPPYLCVALRQLILIYSVWE